MVIYNYILFFALFILRNNQAFSRDFTQNNFPFGSSPLQQIRTQQGPSFHQQAIMNTGMPFHFKSLFKFPSFTHEDNIEIPVPPLQPFPPFSSFRPFSLFKDLNSKESYIPAPESRPDCPKVMSNFGTVRNGMFNEQRAPDPPWQFKSNHFDSSVEYVYEYDLPSLVEDRRERPNKKPNCPLRPTYSSILTTTPTITSTESEEKNSKESTGIPSQTIASNSMTTEGTSTIEGVPTRSLTTELNWNFENMSKNIDEEKLLKLFTYIFDNRIDFLKSFITNHTNNKLTEGLTKKYGTTQQMKTTIMPSTSTSVFSYTQSTTIEVSSTDTSPSESSSTESSSTMSSSIKETQAHIPMPPLEPESVVQQIPIESPDLGPVKPGVVPKEVNFNEIDSIK